MSLSDTSTLQSEASTIISPSDDENASIVTIRANAEAEGLHLLDSAEEEEPVATISGQLQTIVEVVNPILSGEGFATEIAVGRSADCSLQSFDDEDDDEAEEAEIDGVVTNAGYVEEDSYNEEDYEMSLNDKMKNVLQELLENERVKLSFSKSLTEEQKPDGDSTDDEFGNDQLDGSAGAVYKNGSHDEDVRNSNVNIDDCQIYENPNFAHETDARRTAKVERKEKLSQENEKLKEKLLSELNVDAKRGADGAGGLDNVVDDDDDVEQPECENDDAGDDVHIQGDESLQEISEETSTATPSTTSTGKSTNNNSKKKKRKGKSKKK